MFQRVKALKPRASQPRWFCPLETCGIAWGCFLIAMTCQRAGCHWHLCAETRDDVTHPTLHKTTPPHRIVPSEVSVMWVERPCLRLRPWAQRFSELCSVFQFTWARRLTSLNLSFLIWKVKIVISLYLWWAPFLTHGKPSNLIVTTNNIKHVKNIRMGKFDEY